MKNGLKECDGGGLGIKHMNPVLALPSDTHLFLLWDFGMMDTTQSF